MMEVMVAEAGELGETAMKAAQTLVRSAFGAAFRTHDWLHALGGVHVVVTDDDTLVAHAAVVPRILRHDGRTLETGYVEAVAVGAEARGRGCGRIVMDHAESIIRTRHDIGALNAVESAANFYGRRGWQPWCGPTRADTPAGTIDTFDPADRIFLFPARSSTPLAADEPLVCDWRPGDLW